LKEYLIILAGKPAYSTTPNSVKWTERLSLQWKRGHGVNRIKRGQRVEKKRGNTAGWLGFFGTGQKWPRTASGRIYEGGGGKRTTAKYAVGGTYRSSGGKIATNIKPTGHPGEGPVNAGERRERVGPF